METRRGERRGNERGVIDGQQRRLDEKATIKVSRREKTDAKLGLRGRKLVFEVRIIFEK